MFEIVLCMYRRQYVVQSLRITDNTENMPGRGLDFSGELFYFMNTIITYLPKYIPVSSHNECNTGRSQ